MYLNESIDNLKIILSNESKMGPIPIVRDIIFDSIAQQVWNILILTASQSVNHIEELSQWQLSVLKQFAPLMYNDSDEESAIEELISDAHNNSEIESFLSKMSTAVQNKLKLDKSVKNLLNLSIKENSAV